MRIIRQVESTECALACLAMIADHHGFRSDLAQLRVRFGPSLKGTPLSHLLTIAAELGLSSRPVKAELEHIRSLRLPCILHWNNRHFVVLTGASRKNVDIVDPAVGAQRLSYEQLSKNFTGVAVEFTPNIAFRAVDERESLDFRRLFGTMTGLKRSFVQIAALAACLEIFAIFAPLFNKWMIDEVLPRNDLNLYWVLIVGFSLMLIMRIVTSYGRASAVIYLSSQFGVQWGASLLNRLLNVPLSYFEKRNLSDISSRFGSFSIIQRTLTTTFVETILDGAMCLVSLVAMIMLSERLTLVVIITTILYTILRTASFARLKQFQEDSLLASAKQQGHLLESIRGILPIRLFSKAELRSSTWQNLLIEEVNSNNRTQYALVNLSSANSLLQGTKDLLIFAIGIRLIIDQQLSIGSLMAFAAYGASFSGRANVLVDRISDFRMLKLHAERVADFALLEPEVQTTLEPRTALSSNDGSPSISFQNVSFRYAQGEPYVLDRLSFVVNSGESVAIVGASGIGKSTLIKLLLGVYQPTEGAILIDNVPLTKYGLRKFRDSVGSVLQEDTLFAGSIAENISFFDDGFAQEWVEKCAIDAAVHDEIIAMPMRYNTLIGDMGSALSGGQKQRVLLARALYKKPKVFVLDEATSHLDLANESIVNASIRGLKATRIFVAHRPDTIRTADRIVDLAALASNVTTLS